MPHVPLFQAFPFPPHHGYLPFMFSLFQLQEA